MSTGPSWNQPPTPAACASPWKRIEHYLGEIRHLVHDEIRSYPRPIPACDVQFNFLLEQRASLDAEIKRLQEAQQNDASAQSIQQFLDSSPYLSNEAKQRLSAFPSADAPVN